MARASILAKAFRGVKKVFSCLFGGGQTADHRHEERMEELRAFQSGKLTPRYLAMYAGVIIFGGLSALVIVDECWPGAIPGNPGAAVERIAGTCLEALKTIFGM